MQGMWFGEVMGSWAGGRRVRVVGDGRVIGDGIDGANGVRVFRVFVCWVKGLGFDRPFGLGARFGW